jgi:hypothetical protein
MNYFVEGLQGSGKSTLVQKLSDKTTGYTVVREGDYSPVELAWCAYVDKSLYESILEKYNDLADEIRSRSYAEDGKMIICYTKVASEDRCFYEDLEQYEIYNGRLEMDEFRDIVLGRYKKWNSDNFIFECSILQNTIEDMTLFRCAEDDEIIAYYDSVRAALEGKEYRILYLKTGDVEGNLNTIRKERSDENGKELWFPLMMDYFNRSPYARANNLQGEDALIEHFKHRQSLELRILQEVFSDRSIILGSKKYTDKDFVGIV